MKTEAKEGKTFDVTMEQPLFHYMPNQVATNIVKYGGRMDAYHLKTLAMGVVYEISGEEIPARMDNPNASFAMMDNENPYIAEFLDEYGLEHVSEWESDFSSVDVSERRAIMIEFLSGVREDLVEKYNKMISKEEEE